MNTTSSSHDEQFMATISHELRGPLHAILGLSEVLMESDLSDGDNRLAEALHREASAMRVLVDDVIAYGQFSSTTPTLRESPFAPRVLVTSVVDRLRGRAEEAGLRLLVEFDSAVPLRVLGDSVRFGQVVDNLVSNAIRYTEVGSVQVILAADPDSLSLQVRDTGVGISADNLDSIFDPFVRVGSSAVRGTGLGLSVVQRISEVMDGTIAVDSTPGVGTTFLFTIPAIAVTESADEQAELTKAGKGRVLIVEDSEINRTLALKQLEILDISAVAVHSGEMALEFFASASESVDLILMDWNLPGISGLETAAQIRHECLVDKAVPIIAMTANVLAGDRDTCLDAGMNDHLGKPVSLDDMRQMMNRWLAGNESEAIVASDDVGTAEPIRDALDRLQDDLGDIETVRIVVESYLGELSSRTTLLVNLDQASQEDAKRAAHTLRSTSALLGADRLAGLCHEFELMDQPDEALVQRLKKEIEAVESQFTQLLKTGIAA